MRKLLRKFREDYRLTPCIASLALLPARRDG